MKKTSTKLFLAAATLGLAAASTIGSTYAWFTINGSAKVSGFDMKVAGDTGVFIREHSTTDVAFDVEYQIPSTVFENKKFTAVSPKAGSNLSVFQTVNIPLTIADDSTAHNYVLADVTGLTNSNGVYGKDAVSYYYVLDLDVRVTAGTNINILPTAFSSTATNGNTCKAENVLRIGVLTYAADGETVAGQTIYGLSKTSSESTDYATVAFKEAFVLSNLNANPKDNHTVIDDTHPALVSPITNTGEDVSKWNTERVTIVVWYEGSSWECSNEIFDQKVSFSLLFKSVKTA